MLKPTKHFPSQNEIEEGMACPINEKGEFCTIGPENGFLNYIETETFVGKGACVELDGS
jgi:hypothetical protein